MERQLTLTTNSKKLLLKSAGLSSKDYVNDVIALYGSRFGKTDKTIEKNLFAYLLKEENKKRQTRNDAIEVKALIKKYEKPKAKKKIIIAKERLVSIKIILLCERFPTETQVGKSWNQPLNFTIKSNKPNNCTSTCGSR